LTHTTLGVAVLEHHLWKMRRGWKGVGHREEEVE
jgi:hypothetical protein